MFELDGHNRQPRAAKHTKMPASYLKTADDAYQVTCCSVASLLTRWTGLPAMGIAIIAALVVGRRGLEAACWALECPELPFRKGSGRCRSGAAADERPCAVSASCLAASCDAIPAYISALLFSFAPERPRLRSSTASAAKLPARVPRIQVNISKQTGGERSCLQTDASMALRCRFHKLVNGYQLAWGAHRRGFRGAGVGPGVRGAPC